MHKDRIRDKLINQLRISDRNLRDFVGAGTISGVCMQVGGGSRHVFAQAYAWENRSTRPAGCTASANATDAGACGCSPQTPVCGAVPVQVAVAALASADYYLAASSQEALLV